MPPESERGGPVGAGCGLLLGLLVGVYWFITAESPQWPIIGVALVLAGLAYWYGDRLWNWLADHGWWLRWW
jgi:hypothetical protein